MRIVGLIGGYAALIAVVTLLGPASVRPYLIGAGAAAVSALAYFILALDGAEGARMGAEAERWSSSALRRLGRSRWRVVDSVPFEMGDVDHVAIGPDGVIAVETKYTSSPSEVRDPELRGPLGRPVDQAKLGARRIGLLLRSEGLDVRVAPALAVWGPGSERLVTDSIDGVVLLVGREATTWHDQLPGTGQRLTEAETARIEQVLKRHVAETARARRRAHRPSGRHAPAS